MPQNRKESSSPAGNKTASRDCHEFRRRGIHDGQKKKSGSLKDNVNNLYPGLEDYRDKDLSDEDEDVEPNSGKNLRETTTSNENQTIDKLCVSETNVLYKVVAIAIFFFFLFMTGFYLFNMNKSHGGKMYSVSELIDNMRSKFSAQSQHTFKVLKSALKPIVNESLEPPAPAIIILLANRSAMKTACKFSEYLAELLHPKKFFSIDSKIYGVGNPEMIKSNIDEELKSNVNTDSLTVILVDNLRNIPFEAAMIFHSYCDHENARLKRAVYLFVLPTTEPVPENGGTKDIDKTAMNSLRQIWHNAHKDLIESLITRITVSVVNIK